MFDVLSQCLLVYCVFLFIFEHELIRSAKLYLSLTHCGARKLSIFRASVSARQRVSIPKILNADRGPEL